MVWNDELCLVVRCFLAERQPAIALACDHEIGRCWQSEFFYPASNEATPQPRLPDASDEV